MHFPAELKAAGKGDLSGEPQHALGANAGTTDSSASVVEVKLP